MQHFTFVLLSLAIPLHFKRIARLGTKSRAPEKPISLAPESLQMSSTYFNLRGKNLRSTTP